MIGALTAFSKEPAECVITVGRAGTEIVEMYPLLTEVVVESSRAQAWTARLKLVTFRDELGMWAVEDAGVFEPWAPVRITARFGARDEEVFRGYVKQLKSEHPPDQGSSSVTVECQDDSLAMDREHVRKRWGEESLPSSDAQILQEIAVGRYGLMLSQPGTGQARVVGVNQDETDIKFLRKRAEANGYELVVSRGAVYFGPMRLDHTPQPTILVYAGQATNCISMNVTVDSHSPDLVAFELSGGEGGAVESETVAPDVTRLGPRPATSEGAGLKDFVWRMSREGGSDVEALRAKARQKANDLSMKIKGEGELDGSSYGSVLRVGEPVGVDGMGEAHSGIYYVDSVSHTFSHQGYRQRFVLLRNAFGDNLAISSSPLARVMGG